MPIIYMFFASRIADVARSNASRSRFSIVYLIFSMSAESTAAGMSSPRSLSFASAIR